MEVSEKQLGFARKIAQSTGQDIPEECMDDRRLLSEWINSMIETLPKDEEGKVILRPSSKQTDYAERMAGAMGVNLPPECYTDARKISAWIDENKDNVVFPPTEKMLALAEKIRNANPAAPPYDAVAGSMEGLRAWIDENIPQEWSQFSENKRPGKGRRSRGKDTQMYNGF